MKPHPIRATGTRRRDFLQVGLGGILGLGLGDLLRNRARAASDPPASPAGPRPGKAVNCILVWMDGGPSHYETFDPKPEAPAEIRGEFKAIPTRVPAPRLSQCVPPPALSRAVWMKPACCRALPASAASCSVRWR